MLLVWLVSMILGEMEEALLESQQAEKARNSLQFEGAVSEDTDWRWRAIQLIADLASAPTSHASQASSSCAPRGRGLLLIHACGFALCLLARFPETQGDAACLPSLPGHAIRPLPPQCSWLAHCWRSGVAHYKSSIWNRLDFWAFAAAAVAVVFRVFVFTLLEARIPLGRKRRSTVESRSSLSCGQLLSGIGREGEKSQGRGAITEASPDHSLSAVSSQYRIAKRQTCSCQRIPPPATRCSARAPPMITPPHG